MIDSLFDRDMKKASELIAKKKAWINEEEKNFVRTFMGKMDPKTINRVLNVIIREGHPGEKIQAQKLANKYENGEDFLFDEIISIDALYKSNLRAFANKDD